jgi:hypothetical protein
MAEGSGAPPKGLTGPRGTVYPSAAPPRSQSATPDLAEAGSAADRLPDLGLPDLSGGGGAADRQDDVAVADEPLERDLASPDSRDGSGADTVVLDLGKYGDLSASADQSKGELPPVDVPRPDSNVNECAFHKAVSSLYVPPRFDFSLVQPDGFSLSCSTRFNDGGDPVWPKAMTGQISGWVTAVSGSELRVDTCAVGSPCEPAEYRFTVSTAGLTLPAIPIGRRVTVSWWMRYGGWSCPRMLVVTDDGSADAGTPGALWLVGVESMLTPELPLPFAVARQELYCNPDPSGTSHCGGSDNLPDDYAFEFAPQTGEPSLALGTGQIGNLAITLGSGAVQHLSLLTIRCFITGACDDYSNWAWWATGHKGASGDPD